MIKASKVAPRLQLRDVINSEKGVALLIALFAMMTMMVIAVEVTFDTTVDYSVSSQAVNRLKAYYAARAGVELSLLRIKLYRKLAQQMGGSSQQGGQPQPGAIPTQLLDQIWQLPFMWPFPVPDELSGAEKEQIQKTLKESKMQAQYTIRIESEGNKIDINDLASPSEGLAKSTREQVLRIFLIKREMDDAFAERYRGFDFNKLINNIADWVDEDKEGRNGGDESSSYPEANGRPYMPPNQPFKSLNELHMVAGMTDDIFDLLAPRVTVYGGKGININYATKDMLMSLDQKVTDEVVEQIMKYRQEVGPFRNKEDFFAFMKNQGVNTANLEGEHAVPIYFDTESNFRITSTATFGKSSREIIAITFDFDRVKERFVDVLKNDTKNKQQNPADNNQQQQPNQQQGANPQTNQQQTATSNPQVAKGRPNIVYWHED